MYNLLLAPVADAVADKDLIIIPDAAIHYVPFDALLTEAVDAEGGIRDYRTLPYLLREKNVSYIYSATFFQQTMHRQRKTAPRDLLAFAPVFGEEAMGPQNRETGPLPASRDEVEGIDALFGTRYGWFERWFGGKTEVLLTGSATEDRLKTREAALYRYVHLATHGFVDEKEPGQSGLALAQGGRSEDGLLHLGEIYNLNLNADLVVLSACETGLGQLARGEGIIGLTRGFLYAGAANVLVSLWKVDDTTTAQLMQDFYVDLLADFPKTTALRRAKLRLIEKHPRFARPYYWSSFILIGR
jgi:CHAT domain-containing protein